MVFVVQLATSLIFNIKQKATGDYKKINHINPYILPVNQIVLEV